MRDNIYIVIGDNGYTYGDHEVWVVGAFSSMPKAKAKIERIKEWMSNRDNIEGEVGTCPDDSNLSGRFAFNRYSVIRKELNK